MENRLHYKLSILSMLLSALVGLAPAANFNEREKASRIENLVCCK